MVPKIERHDHGGQPSGRVEAGPLTAHLPLAEVDAGPVVEVGGAQLGRRGAPGLIGHELEVRAIRELRLQLREECHLAAVAAAVVRGVPADTSTVPAVTQAGDQDVGTRAQERRDVVGLGQEAVMVGGPAGGQDLVAHGLAIDRDVVKAEGGDVEAGAGDGTGHLELAAQQRRGSLTLAARIVGQRDGARMPVLLPQEPDLDPQGRAPRRPALLRAQPDSVAADLTALERRPRRPNAHLLVARHDAGGGQQRIERLVRGDLDLVGRLAQA